MNPTHTILLEFDPTLNRIAKGKKLSDGLSVVVQLGKYLWVANDETLSIERLTLKEAGRTGEYAYAGEHVQFRLNDYLKLPIPPTDDDPEEWEEADLEGLAYEDGYLWLIGSHSLKRKTPKEKEPKSDDSPEKTVEKAQKRLSIIEGEGNRYLLARIPIEQSDETYVLVKETSGDGKKRTAAQVRGDKYGNDLIDELKEKEKVKEDDKDKDKERKHLYPFFAIPSKDNGFDIEGLAIANGHLFIGLRGPVLRGWSIILEVVPEEDKKDPTRLKLKPFGPDDRAYRKHFLQLGGLGIREMCFQGNDLLILAGPTMGLDGPVSLFRWTNVLKINGESVVPSSELAIDRLSIPYGDGNDHPEGITMLASPDGKKGRSILVVHDLPADHRKFGENTLAADVYRL